MDPRRSHSSGKKYKLDPNGCSVDRSWPDILREKMCKFYKKADASWVYQINRSMLSHYVIGNHRNDDSSRYDSFGSSIINIIAG